MLFVCTANINRSPMAAALFDAHAAAAGRTAHVSSAGILDDGRPASAEAVATLARRHLDLSGHRSRLLSRETVSGIDLVVAMERRHLRAAAILPGAGLDRCFTFKDLLRRALTIGRREAGESVAAWLERVGEGRNPEDLIRDDPADEVEDPVGGTAADFERCADELDLLTEGLCYFLFSAQPATPQPDNRQVLIIDERGDVHTTETDSEPDATQPAGQSRGGPPQRSLTKIPPLPTLPPTAPPTPSAAPAPIPTLGEDTGSMLPSGPALAAAAWPAVNLPQLTRPNRLPRQGPGSDPG